MIDELDDLTERERCLLFDLFGEMRRYTNTVYFEYYTLDIEPMEEKVFRPLFELFMRRRFFLECKNVRSIVLPHTFTQANRYRIRLAERGQRIMNLVQSLEEL